MAKRQKREPEDRAPMVYCGPTIPGVAKQFTTYTNGLSGLLEDAARRSPAVRGLIVPLEQLPDVMRQLKNKSGNIYALYCRAVQGKN
jgi:hypothetical protein